MTGTHQKPSVWPRFLGLAVLGVILAMVAVVGASTVYCDNLLGTMLWAMFLIFLVPAAALVDDTAMVLWPLISYLVVVFIIARYTRFLPSVLMFTLAVIVTYALSVGIVEALGWRGGSCAFA